MIDRELDLAKREGELAARETEADLRAADLEVFRAMLVNQESTVKDLTSEAKGYCKTLAESAHSTGAVAAVFGPGCPHRYRLHLSDSTAQYCSGGSITRITLHSVHQLCIETSALS